MQLLIEASSYLTIGSYAEGRGGYRGGAQGAVAPPARPTWWVFQQHTRPPPPHSLALPLGGVSLSYVAINYCLTFVTLTVAAAIDFSPEFNWYSN